MERQAISIRFADLRRLAREVPAWLAEEALGAVPTTLAADVEGEFGLAGYDTADLLQRFAQTYGVELAGFDFTGYISPEPGGLDPDLVKIILFLPAGLGLLATSVLKLMAGLARGNFGARLTHVVQRWQPLFLAAFLPSTPDTRTRILTAGDFVASAAAGRFVTRSQVYFCLARG